MPEFKKRMGRMESCQVPFCLRPVVWISDDGFHLCPSHWTAAQKNPRLLERVRNGTVMQRKGAYTNSALFSRLEHRRRSNHVQA
jgi:hypothetical protein